jgi:HSP20 family protein
MKLARFQRPDVWGWAGLDQLTNLRDEINRLFEAPYSDGGSDVFNTWAPALDVYEDKDNLTVRAELPGLKKEDIDISLHENTITISGERKHEKKYEATNTSRRERFFGRFTRSLMLPKQVKADQVKASYKDGILTVTLPKAEEAKPRQIQVEGNEPAEAKK